MGVQERFWQSFADTKRDACYINLYRARTETIDRGFNIVLAVASNGAIGAWAVWKQAPFLWAGVIAVAQAVNAVRPYLPYSRRLRSLAAFGPELDALVLTLEDDWHKASTGKLTEDEIQERYIKGRRKGQELERKHFAAATLPQSKGLTAKADEIAADFLKAYYGGQT